MGKSFVMLAAHLRERDNFLHTEPLLIYDRKSLAQTQAH